jgi:DNA-binding beta-propeller fold protein YncE
MESGGRFAFVTLRGGGLLVVDVTATPMQIVGEYDAATVHGNGCGGIEAGGSMYLASGGGTAANLAEFDVYRFPTSGYRAGRAANTPARDLLYSDDETPGRDAHGMAATRAGRFLWVADRHANLVEVLDTGRGRRVHRIQLAGRHSQDPSPDLLDLSPSGERMFVSLRGSVPLSGDPHASTGSTPGLMVVKLRDGGRSGVVEGIVPVSNRDAAGVERADPHGIRVRIR